MHTEKKDIPLGLKRDDMICGLQENLIGAVHEVLIYGRDPELYGIQGIALRFIRVRCVVEVDGRQHLKNL
eukprot:6213906-Pleurochrysis_carterae.AAC.3